MKDRIKLLLKVYLWFLVLCILQKPVFILFHKELFPDVTFVDVMQVIYHGLPLDMSVSSYITALPLLLTIMSVWIGRRFIPAVIAVYVRIIAIIMVILCGIDLALYSSWGFRLDATPMFYFLSSPKDAMASVTLFQWIAGGLSLVCVIALLCFIEKYLFRFSEWFSSIRNWHFQSISTVVLLVLGGLLFLMIRGGLGVSTMNTGRVYFSTDVRLNHAAINPLFSLMESSSKQQNFGEQYRYLSDEKAASLFEGMQDKKTSVPDSIPMMLKTNRPNIIFVVMESFSSRLMTKLGGEPDIAVELDRLADESILFTRFYANSFRTDRGLVAILSGYPAQPTTSIMKYPQKSQHLPTIAASLKEEGYRRYYYYGGDADFTNMRSYLASSTFEKVVCDKDFPMSARKSKWGAHDHHVFEKLYQDLKEDKDPTPFFRVLQTSSSHEPFDVPFQKLPNKRLNAFAYSDSCIGSFIRQFKELPQWDNTLVLLVPDHVGCYPEYLNNFSLERYMIPMLWLGGAIKEPARVATLASQHDIAATLLGQLGINADKFIFSKNIFDPSAPHFAFFTVPDAWGMVREDGAMIYDNAADKVLLRKGSADGNIEDCGKAYLQKLYDDLASR